MTRSVTRQNIEGEYQRINQRRYGLAGDRWSLDGGGGPDVCPCYFPPKAWIHGLKTISYPFSLTN